MGVSYELSETCVLFVIPIEIRELLRAYEEALSREGNIKYNYRGFKGNNET